MRLGVFLRNMGPQSSRAMLRECAQAAEASGLDDLWVADHIAIPPDDAAGSGGRYLDPLATLAFLAGVTSRIGLGTGVLVLPYRPALVTAKWIATVQELSQGRMQLGVGAGWMEAEFRAAGVDKQRRGAITDATLEFLHRCFADDEVEAHGQRFLFLPRPQRPPFFIGGSFPSALRRMVRFGEGWMPNGGDPETLRPLVVQLREAAAAAGKPPPEVVVLTSLTLDDPPRAAAQARSYAESGVTRVVQFWRYPDAAGFRRACDVLQRDVRPACAR
jgi:probable F420-dependent oxidoreductase